MLSCKEGCKETLTTCKLKEVKRASHFAMTVSHAHCTSSERPEHPHATFPSSSISQTTDRPHPLLESDEHYSSLRPLFGKPYIPFIHLLPDWFLTRQASFTAVLMTANETTEFSSFLSSHSTRGCVETPGHGPADS